MAPQLRQRHHHVNKSKRSITCGGLLLAVILIGSSVVLAGFATLPQLPLARAEEPPTTTLSETNGKILFVGNVGQNEAIFSINPDGSDLRQLTPNNAISSTSGALIPVGSSNPTGTKIAFQWVFDRTSNVYTMNGDGSGFRQVTFSKGPSSSDVLPMLSPDGTKVAFRAQKGIQPEIPTSSVGVTNFDGSGLTTIDAAGKMTSLLRWLPDSKRLVIDDGGGQGIAYTINFDGTGLKRLPVPLQPFETKDFSPDGNKIVYRALNSTACCPILLINTDGTGTPKELAANGADPIWSPDGTKIAYAGTDNGSSSSIFLVNADGAGPTKKLADGGGPIWSPDGTKIAFQKNPDTRSDPFASDLYVINTADDGSGQKKLATAAEGFGHITWSPDSSKIAFTKPGDGNIYVVNAAADGSGLTKIITPKPLLAGFGDLFVWTVAAATATQPPKPQAHTLSVISVGSLSGKPVSGVWTTIRNSSSMNGTLLKSGYTPLTFVGNAGTQYKVTVANYDGKIFQHWNDNTGAGGTSTSNTRTVDLTSNTTLTAVYNTGHSLRGFTSLTYHGSTIGRGGAPDLTVNALSLDGNRTLHMWTIIDPQQSTNATGTMYKVYATNGYQNLTFDHWGDNGSTDRVRTLTIAKSSTITAYYKIG